MMHYRMAAGLCPLQRAPLSAGVSLGSWINLSPLQGQPLRRMEFVNDCNNVAVS